MQVLVTGANGFVGAHLCRRLLEAGAEVRGLVRETSDLRLVEELDVDLVTGDILEPPSLDRAAEGCEQVYHTAAMVRFFAPDPEPMRRANVEGTRNVLEAARAAGANRIVHTSTVAVLKRHADGTLSDETMPATKDEVIGAYERTKLEAERVARDAADDGLPVVVVNPSGPVGPGDYKPSPMGRTILQFLRGGIPVYTKTGLNVVDVRDVAEGHVQAAEEGEVGERYILAGENLSLKEFLEILSDLSGVPAPSIRVPWALTLVGGLVGEVTGRITGEQPLACMASVKMSRHPHHFSNEKARRELGFDPRPVREALADEIDWFREEGMVEDA